MHDSVVIRTTQDLQQALQAGIRAERLEVYTEDVSALEARARAAGFEEGRKAALRQSAEQLSADVRQTLIQGERERIRAIWEATEKGLEACAEEAISSGETVEDFAYRQLRTIRDRGITLRAIRADAPPPAPFAGAPSGDEPMGARRTNPKDVYASRRAYMAPSGK